MPSREEEDREAKRKAREERRKSDSSRSNRREDSDRRAKDRARSSRSSGGGEVGAFSASERSTRSSRSAGSSRREDSDRRAKDRARSSRSSGGSAAQVGAHASSDSKDPARSKGRSSRSGKTSGSSSSNRDRREKDRARSGSGPASTPGAVASTNEDSQSRRESRKAGRNASKQGTPTSARSRDDKVKRKLAAAGLSSSGAASTAASAAAGISGPPLLDDEEKQVATNPDGGELLVEALAVDDTVDIANNPAPQPAPEPAPSPEQAETPPRQEKSNRVYKLIILLLLLGIGGGAAYFFLKPSDEAPVVPATENPATSGVPVNTTEAPATTSVPSLTPTQNLKYDPPSEGDCQRIAAGLGPLEAKPTVLRSYKLTMDVQLSFEGSLLNLESLQNAMQAKFVPDLAGCSGRSTPIQAQNLINIQYVIYNGNVDLELVESESCQLPGMSSSPCYVVQVNLDLELKGDERQLDVTSIILETVNTDDLVSQWQLLPPNKKIVVRDATSAQPPPTTAPIVVESENPAAAPVIIVAESENPTKTPTANPTIAQTSATTPNPTFATPQPTVTTGLPTKAPSVSPSKTPTKVPTKSPTKLPTAPPTKSPTKIPTKSPTKNPTQAPTAVCDGRTAMSYNGATVVGIYTYEDGRDISWEVDLGSGSMRWILGSDKKILGRYGGLGVDGYTWNYSNGDDCNGVGRYGSVHMQYVTDTESYATFTDNYDTTCREYRIDLYISTTSCALPADRRYCDGKNAMSYNGATVRGLFTQNGNTISYEVDLGFGSARSSWWNGDWTEGYFDGYTDDYTWNYSNGDSNNMGYPRCAVVHLNFLAVAESYSTAPNPNPDGACSYRIDLYISTTTCELPAEPTMAPSTSTCPFPPLLPAQGPVSGPAPTSPHYTIVLPKYPVPGANHNKYVYDTVEEASTACENEGLILCPRDAAQGDFWCAAAHFSDGYLGYWSQGGGGCGYNGWNNWYGSGGTGNRMGGAMCCGTPLYIPEDPPRHIYSTQEEAAAGCAARGLGLCSEYQVSGFTNCNYGWTSDGTQVVYDSSGSECGPDATDTPGMSYGTWPKAGAYCCVTNERICDSESCTFDGSDPNSNHFVYFMPDTRDNPNYPWIYPTRWDAAIACESKGLTLCPVAGITNFERCTLSWLSDGIGWWMNDYVQGGPGCLGPGYHDRSDDTDPTAIGLAGYGAFCCGCSTWYHDTNP